MKSVYCAFLAMIVGVEVSPVAMVAPNRATSEKGTAFLI